MLNNRQDVDLPLVRKLAEMTNNLVNYINKMNPEDLRNLTALVRERNSTFSWLYNRMPAMRSLPVQSSLEIAVETFNSADCVDGSINAQILRELVKKSEGEAVEKELQKEHIVKLGLFVYEKLSFEMKQFKAGKFDVKSDVQAVKLDESENDKLVKLDKVDITTLPKKEILMLKMPEKTITIRENKVDVVKQWEALQIKNLNILAEVPQNKQQKSLQKSFQPKVQYEPTLFKQNDRNHLNDKRANIHRGEIKQPSFRRI